MSQEVNLFIFIIQKNWTGQLSGRLQKHTACSLRNANSFHQEMKIHEPQKFLQNLSSAKTYLLHLAKPGRKKDQRICIFIDAARKNQQQQDDDRCCPPFASSWHARKKKKAGRTHHSSPPPVRWPTLFHHHQVIFFFLLSYLGSTNSRTSSSIVVVKELPRKAFLLLADQDSGTRKYLTSCKSQINGSKFNFNVLQR